MYHPYLHVDDITDEEYVQSWYTPNDLQRIMMENIKTIELSAKQQQGIIKKREAVLPRGFCLRGLVEYNPQQLFLNKNKKNGGGHISVVHTAVLSEQERQWIDEVYDEERIREASVRRSKQETKRAVKIGKRDEMEIISIGSSSGKRNQAQGKLRRLISFGSGHRS